MSYIVDTIIKISHLLFAYEGKIKKTQNGDPEQVKTPPQSSDDFVKQESTKGAKPKNLIITKFMDTMSLEVYLRLTKKLT